MLRLGAPAGSTRDMDLDHIYICRLKMLVVMVRAYLLDYPLGEYRKAAMVHNADYIAAESVDLEQLIPLRSQPVAKDNMKFDHVFFQRVKLLASMARAIGQGQSMGEHQIVALSDNLGTISEHLRFTSGVKKVRFLRVA